MESVPLGEENPTVPLRRQIQDEEEEAEVAPSIAENIEQRIPPPRGIRMHLPQLQRSYELFQNSGVWRKGNYAVILYFMPLSIALFIVLLVDWKRDCDKPLKLWASADLCIQSLSLFLNIFIILKLPPTDAPIDYQVRRIRSLHYFFVCNRVLLVLWAAWFFIGMGWSFETLFNNSCPKTAPFLFRMCFSIVVIQLIIFVFILVFCCCACLVAGLRVFVYIPESSNASSRGATESMIRALPYKKFKDGILPKEDSNCAICLSDYELSELIRFLPCDHHFHTICVDQWLLTNKTCPFCKQEIDSKEAKKLKGAVI